MSFPFPGQACGEEVLGIATASSLALALRWAGLQSSMDSRPPGENTRAVRTTQGPRRASTRLLGPLSVATPRLTTSARPPAGPRNPEPALPRALARASRLHGEPC